MLSSFNTKPQDTHQHSSVIYVLIGVVNNQYDLKLGSEKSFKSSESSKEGTPRRQKEDHQTSSKLIHVSYVNVVLVECWSTY